MKKYIKPTTETIYCEAEAIMLTASIQVNDEVETTDMLTEKKNMWGKENMWK